jgi:hypothetical protein
LRARRIAVLADPHSKAMQAQLNKVHRERPATRITG